MKQFIIRLGSFMAVAWFTLMVVDYGYSRKLAASNNYWYETWYDVLRPHPASDVVCIGSSRAFNFFVPSVIDSLLRCYSWNLGIAGAHAQDFPYRYVLFRRFNPPPRLVVQVLDYFMFHEQSGDSFEKWQLYPFFWDASFRREVFRYRHFSFAERFLPLYRYCGNGIWPRKGRQNRYRTTSRGYSVIELEWDRTRWEKQDWYKKMYDDVWPSPERVAEYEDFLAYLQEEGCQVVFVCPPAFAEADRSFLYIDSIRACFRNLSEKHDIPLLDYTRGTMSLDSTLFFDGLHMNYRGAVQFSDSLAADLNKLYHFVQ